MTKDYDKKLTTSNSYLIHGRSMVRTSDSKSENQGSIPCGCKGHGLIGKASSLGLEDYRFKSGCPEAGVAQW